MSAMGDQKAEVSQQVNIDQTQWSEVRGGHHRRQNRKVSL